MNNIVPSMAEISALQSSILGRVCCTEAHCTDAKASIHTSMERFTCVTSAVWKKSLNGIIAWKPGVRESASNNANSPDTASADIASTIHPLATERDVSGKVREKLSGLLFMLIEAS